MEAFPTVEVRYEQRDNAILTIYEDGMEKERLVLSDLPTSDDMYDVLVNRGFERIEPEHAEAILAVRQAEKRAEEERERVQQEAFIERRKKDHARRIANGETIN